MAFSTLDIILFAGASQGIFLAAALRLLHDRNKEANFLLSIALLCAVAMLLGRILVFRVQGVWVSPLALVVDTTIFLFGPLLYFFMQRLLFLRTRNNKRNGFHYAPAIFHLVYALIAISISVFQEKPLIHSKFLMQSGFVIETLGLISLLGYTLWCAGLLKKHLMSSKYALSYIHRVHTFLKVVVGVMLVLVALWGISYVTSYFIRVRIPYLNYNTLWITVPLFIYAVGYFSLSQPEIFRVPELSSRKKEKARLKPDEIGQLQKRLHYFMNEEQIYQESELSLKTLAERLNTTANNLSWLLNQVYQKSFYDYINEFRIQDVVHCIDLKMHKKQTILSLAFDAGFNSKSTFNKAFKNVTGLTPSAYIKNKQVA